MGNRVKILLSLVFLTSQVFAQNTSFKFDFGPGKVASGYTQILPTSVYSKENGYGFMMGASLTGIDRNGKNALKTDFLTSDKPFFFTIDVPEGNYDVKINMGDEEGTSSQTIRAECRRLMLNTVETSSGKVETRKFTVSVRYAEIAGTTAKVNLKPRELNYFHWDHQLTLEFNGKQPKIASIEISKNTDAVTVFLAGNSTVVDQVTEPWAAWGQMFPSFFKAGKIAIANHAESGETLKAFTNERRLEKILSQMKKGDYLFMEFTHNDQKPGATFVEPFTTYKEMLKVYISETRKKGGIPVLVTSMHRRTFDTNGKITNSLGDYPEAMRQTAKEENVALIDLNAMSKTLYEAWGPVNSVKAFVHYPARTFPGQMTELKDDTHFNTYGAYQLAKCVVAGAVNTDLPLTKFLVSNLPAYDPANPDPFDSWAWPLSPITSNIKPDGN